MFERPKWCGIIFGPPPRSPCVARRRMLGVFRPEFRFWTGHVWARRPVTWHVTLHASVENRGSVAALLVVVACLIFEEMGVVISFLLHLVMATVAGRKSHILYILHNVPTAHADFPSVRVTRVCSSFSAPGVAWHRLRPSQPFHSWRPRYWN